MCGCRVLLLRTFNFRSLYFAASNDLSVICANRLYINSGIILKLLDSSGACIVYILFVPFNWCGDYKGTPTYVLLGAGCGNR